MNDFKNKCRDAIMGFVVGDALGVPVEFVSREKLRDNPVTGMLGGGTHNQPAGTWSDDSSMSIATMIIADILYRKGKDKFTLMKESLLNCRQYLDSESDEETLNEMQNYSRLWDLQSFKILNEDKIKSSGYVVDTLEAALWCFLNTDNYKDCVLKAVNLGDDTDTVGAVAGGMAGLYYGIEEVPNEWLEVIPKNEEILELIEKM